jgi:heme oxygenase
VDRDVATMILTATHRSGRELADLVPFIKEHCDKEEYERISIAIATVLHDLDATIQQPIYQEHPDVEREIEDRVERFGRTF